MNTTTQKALENELNAVVQSLTLDEKIGMIHGCTLFKTRGVEGKNIPPLITSDGTMGVRAEYKDDEWALNGNSQDYASYCSSNTAIASTWNVEFARKSGAVLGKEARGRGKDIILAPGINIKRNPLCGRNFEYLSEDPYLVGMMAVAIIEGIENEDVAACVKHFALNSQETERFFVNVDVSERALREIYLKGFEMAVKEAHVRSIMAAYNLYNGLHCCENTRLLKEILRDEWQFDGVIISDWGGVHNTENAVKSTLDIEMSVTPDFDDYYMANPLKKMINNGEISEDYVDDKIRNILRLMVRLNMITIKDGIVSKNTARKRGSYNTHENRLDILEVAREAVILLKNEDNVLPLDKEHVQKLLVVGDNATTLHANGGGSAEIKALYEVSPMLGICQLLGGNTEVKYAQGEEAINLAKEYDNVIFVGGLSHDYDVEGKDRDNICLVNGQDEMINKLLDANENTIICIIAGSVVDTSKWKDKAKAIIYMPYNGMEGGTALAEVIFGDVNPSGKLSETFCYEDSRILKDDELAYPGRVLSEDEKKNMNANLTQVFKEGVLVGYRYYEKYNIPVAFPFGHGLSYTKFEYQNVKVDVTDKDIVVEVMVANVGKVVGKEVVQVYIGEKNVSEDNPIKELKAFSKVEVEQGTSKSVVMTIPKESIAHFDEEKGSFLLKEGEYVVYVGASLEDIRAKEDILI